MSRVLNLTGVTRTFHQGRDDLNVLRGVDLELRQGEIVALVGPSGSGKSTLLHIAGLLEAPDSGDVAIAGQSCIAMNDQDRTAMRREHLGFVYQNHHLLPEFSALENVALPQIIAGRRRAAAKTHAADLLTRFGLAERLDHRPSRLSGGEQQRAAIARAIANGPPVLLADEPTGNLDHGTADTVFAELLTLARRRGLAALIATHDRDLAAATDRVLVLQDGMLIPQ